ncbi:hypothetical protein BGZ83_009470, partial [Gryganskiella cystojenkinii]
IDHAYPPSSRRSGSRSRVPSADQYPSFNDPTIEERQPTKYSYSLPISTVNSASGTPKRRQSPTRTGHRRNQSQGHIAFPTLSFPSTQLLPDNNTDGNTDTHPAPTTHVLVVPVPPPESLTIPKSIPLPPTPGLVRGNQQQEEQQQQQEHRPAVVATAATERESRESYTLSDRTSTLIETIGDIPPPLIGSTTTIHNNKMFVFGGKAAGSKVPTNDLYVLDLSTQIWLRVNETVDSSKKNSAEQQQQNRLSATTNANNNIAASRSMDTAFAPTPRARYDHSAILVAAPPLVQMDGSLRGWGNENEAHLVIHGGRTCLDEATGTETCLRDTHILDLETLRWIPTSFAHAHSRTRKAESARESPIQPVTAQTTLYHRRRPEKQLSLIDEGSLSLPRHSNLTINTSIATSPTTTEPYSPEMTPSLTTLSEPKSPTTTRKHTLPESSANTQLSWDNNFAALGEDTPSHLLNSPTSTPKRVESELRQRRSSLPPPVPRSGHLASLSGDRMVIVGGQGIDGQSIHEIDVLDLKRQVWSSGGRISSDHSRHLSTVAASDEKPMARRRRRYLESLAADLAHISSTPQQSFSPAPSSAMLDPLLNPRKNSWHRGEGQPFDIPASPKDFRQRFRSESGLVLGLERDDSIWNQQGGDRLNRPSPGPLVGLGMDSGNAHPSTPLTKHHTFDESLSRSRQSSLGYPKSPEGSIASSAGNSERSRARSYSNAQRPVTLKTAGRSATVQSTSGHVTHAVPAKFFQKSSGSVFDLDDLATTIAREQKVQSKPSTTPTRPTTSGGRVGTPERTPTPSVKNSRRRGSASGSSTNGSDILSPTSRRGSEGTIGSATLKQAQAAANAMMENVTHAAAVAKEARSLESQQDSKAVRLPIPAFQPIYVYANREDKEYRTKRDFIKVQARAGAWEESTASYKLRLDQRSEWAALDEPSSILGSTEGLLPPKLLAPVGHVVDHYFLLSGASLVNQDNSHLPSKLMATLLRDAGSAEMLPQMEGQPTKRRSFSVWMHHLQNHQWTQLELSKGLGSGHWTHSVHDPEVNYLYVLGQRWDHEGMASMLDGLGQDENSTVPTVFTHIVKVDLEGFEISPAVDEPSVGTLGVNMGLQMLRDGIGSDVVLVSSADGGRVRVNSGIVGQRWGYFQALMVERDKIRQSKARNETDEQDISKDYLQDLPSEIVVRESTPILVGFLQYLYTNELSTVHQLKLKNLQGLLHIAHIYDLTRLRQLVRQELYRQLNANNAPSICEVAVLTQEHGLQTRALRTLLQSARLAQLRRQGEAAEAKRRLEFAVSRLEEIEEDRKRKDSAMKQQNSIQEIINSARVGSPSAGHATLFNPAVAAAIKSGSVTSSNSASATSTPGLGAIGRFFRGREESADMTSSGVGGGTIIHGPGSTTGQIYAPEFDTDLGSIISSPNVRMRTVSATTSGSSWEPGKSHLRSKSFHHPVNQQIDPSHVFDPTKSPAISTHPPARNMTAPVPSTPLQHLHHLTLAQKIHRRLSMKPRDGSLDYFRPSHYHQSSHLEVQSTGQSPYQQQPRQRQQQQVHEQQSRRTPPDDVSPHGHLTSAFLSPLIPAVASDTPSSAIHTPSPTHGSNGLTIATQIDRGFESAGGLDSTGSSSVKSSNQRYSYSSIESDGTNSVYDPSSSTNPLSEEINKDDYSSATVSSISLSTMHSSTQSLDQIQNPEIDEEEGAAGSNSSFSVQSNTESDPIPAATMHHTLLTRRLSKRSKKQEGERKKQLESQRRREQKAAERAAASSKAATSQISGTMNAFTAYR